jgi:hypothetical protein
MIRLAALAAALGALVACTPAALDVPLDPDAVRHWASGDLYRLPDDACAGAVADSEGTSLLTVRNEYFETPIVAAFVDPDCEPLAAWDLAPGEERTEPANVPFTLRVETVEGEVLSVWTGFFPGTATLHVQP